MIIEVGITDAKLIDPTEEEALLVKEYLTHSKTTFLPGRRRITEKRSFFNALENSFPSGLVHMVQRMLEREALDSELVDTRNPTCVPDPSADLRWLRDYQREAVERVVKKSRGILWLATGAGKTELAIGITRRLPGRWVMIVDEKDLLHQAADRYDKRTEEHGLNLDPAGRFGDGKYDVGDFTVATMQTISRRIGTPAVQKMFMGTTGIIVDECFPAGTMIGEKRIEDLKPGDLVQSWDGAPCVKPVVRLFKSKAHSLVRLHFADGSTVCCTAGHPFLTSLGWVPAYKLCGSFVVQCTYGQQEESYTVHRMRGSVGAYDHESSTDSLVQALPSTEAFGTPEVCHASVHRVRNVHATVWEEWVEAREESQCLLHQLPTSCEEEVRICSWYSIRGGEECSYESTQPYEASGSSCKDVAYLAANRAQTSLGGGERTRDHETAEALTEGVRRRLGYGVSGYYVQGERTSGLHIHRHSQYGEDDSNRSGRRVSPFIENSRGGQKKDLFPTTKRVDRVEVLEQGCDGTFGGVCSDGYVYNFEVADTHTYVVGGNVVHNCHKTGADTFHKVIQSFKWAYYRVGMSGTPLDRSDKKSFVVVGGLGPVIYRKSAKELIEAGHLARPRITLVPVFQGEKIDRPTYQGTYGVGVVRSAVRNRTVVDIVRSEPGPTLVFVKEVEHGKELNKRLHKAGIESEFVWGSKDTKARSAAIKRLEHGDIDVIVCSVVFQTGTDIPSVRTLVNAAAGQSVIASLQRLGRGMRTDGGKKMEFRVFDIYDEGQKWLERHAKKRRKAYEREGFDVQVDSNRQIEGAR